MAILRRFQTAHEGTAKTSQLYKAPWMAQLALRSELRHYRDRNPIKWKRDGTGWQEARGPFRAARQILRDASKQKAATVYKTSVGVLFYLRVAAVETPTNIPAAALKTKATKLTLRFHTEMQLVFVNWKDLGLYVPRTLKDPGSTYWSEHAWAAANDTAMKDEKNPGAYETDPARLFPFLQTVTDYVLANFTRLGVNEHIFNKTAHKATPSGSTAVPYTGSDPHQTHTHTQFADHGGHKPPWL